VRFDPRAVTASGLIRLAEAELCLRTWDSGKYRMKYLLNLPLAGAALLQAWFASLVFMSAPWSGWSDGPSRRDGAREAGARRARMDPAAAGDRRIRIRRCIRLVARPPAMVAADIGALGASVLIGILVIPCVLSRSEGALPSGKSRTNISAWC
jgi:hypothetical protein